MVTTNFWLVGTSALGVVIFGIAIGIFSIFKARKLEQKLLRNFGIMAIFMGLLLLGPATDFLIVLITTISTGTGVNLQPLQLYAILSYMWVAPALIMAMYIGGTLLTPKAKWYIVGIYTILGVIFEYLLFRWFFSIDIVPGGFFDAMDPFTDPLGQDVIDASFNNASFAFILVLIFILSALLFDGIGALRKSFQLTGDLKKKFLYLSVGFILFTLAAVIDALFNIAIILFLGRFAFIADNIFLYMGIR